MKYPFKYPMLYGELAMQAKTKKELADYLQISLIECKLNCSYRYDIIY